MSDHNERACRNCGSYLHHEDECPKPSPDAMSGLDAEDIEQIEQALELKMYNIEMAHLQQLLRMLYSKVKTAAASRGKDREAQLEEYGNRAMCADMDLLKAKSEIERLKRLVEQQFFKYYDDDFQNDLWEQFAVENNLLNKDQNVQVSDTTGSDSSNAADQQIISELKEKIAIQNELLLPSEKEYLEKFQEKLKEKDEQIEFLKMQIKHLDEELKNAHPF